MYFILNSYNCKKIIKTVYYCLKQDLKRSNKHWNLVLSRFFLNMSSLVAWLLGLVDFFSC